MALTQTIRCIVKDDRYSPYERIRYVGGTNPDNSRWKQTQEETIREIDNREWEYYVEARGHRVKVITAVSRFGNRYLKTEADGDTPDNLLSLPQCP